VQPVKKKTIPYARILFAKTAQRLAAAEQAARISILILCPE